MPRSTAFRSTLLARALLAPPEGQQLARQRGAALGRRVDLAQVVAHGIAVGQLAQQRPRQKPRITDSRLLKSWATPPASRPTASSFCACSSRAWLSRSAAST